MRVPAPSKRTVFLAVIVASLPVSVCTIGGRCGFPERPPLLAVGLLAFHDLDRRRTRGVDKVLSESLQPSSVGVEWARSGPASWLP